MQENYNKDMPIFTVPKPTLGSGEYVLEKENLTPITLACCQNVQNLAPNSDNKDIVQSCSQQIEQSIKNVSQQNPSPTPEPAQPTPSSTPSTPPTPSPTPSSTPSSTPKPAPSLKPDTQGNIFGMNQWVVYGTGFGLLCCCLLIIIMIAVTLSYA